ncbi:uncharacterized protein LAESUDRAFT_724407 [Laetiporus sulphureus 93-53]|uniref:F-box domain-containing protein n=1 Tax=Laetiporus sulphureus 93-53 TaxID=1314785 RepID=A0A165EXM0_9APHY|nr:uncharacterized protein LAESUDRAFT_724407 [Laetiporus sulphureus 93-53]KZT07930.1 hypothetical protein LAESUDRAFT_724407 [Laetiporus sulphureus 93-53]
MDHHPSLSSPCLPTEICDYILDHLWDDHETLKVCSRVTREWLPTTRKHLFSFVFIINLRVVTFAEMIMHSGDALAFCVRQLFLVWYLGQRGINPVPKPTFVPRMLASLGRLEKLTLRVYMLDNCSSSAETITWPILPVVKTLRLRIDIVNDVVRLQRFICACPSLSSLKLWITQTSKCDSSHTHPTMVISRSIVIETFQYHVCESDPILRWLLQGGLKLRIRRLAIIVPDLTPTPTAVNFFRTGDAQALLRACGECLEHLIVEWPETISPGSPDGQQASALAHNPNLVSIYVSSVWCGFSVNDGWLGLFSVLADIEPMHTKLQSIDITLVAAFKPDSTISLCEQLDAALARIADTHPRLIFTIWITCNLRIPAPWLAEFVKVLLQGLVRVQAGPGRLCLMWLNGYDEIRELGHRTKPSWYWQW